MKVETPKQKEKENNFSKILTISNNKNDNSNEINTINSEIITNDCTQKYDKKEINSDKGNINKNENSKSTIFLNKDQLYETFLEFHNYLSSMQNKTEKNNNQKNKDISNFDLDKEINDKNIISDLQFYRRNNIKGKTQENSYDVKSLNFSKINGNKYINESFALNTKNLCDEYSYDYIGNNLESYSASIGDSLQIISYDLLNNKKKKILNTGNLSCEIRKSRDNKKIDNNNLNNKSLKIEGKRKITDYKNKNKETELIKNIKKIKVMKCKEQSSKKISDKNNREQIIASKIKELNYETIKFREEKDKVIKIKNEYEKLHEKLIKEIEDFNIKKNNFEKYKEKEINKINEEKEKLLNERKELNNKKIEKENQSKNISQNDDKETINNLRKYISELQSIIQNKENEIKFLSENNKINNYIINTYKTINTNNTNNENIIKKENIRKRNKMITNNKNEKVSKEFIPNLSYNGMETKCNKKKLNQSNKSISLLNINEYSKIDKINEIQKSIKINPKPNLNMSMKIGSQSTKINYVENLKCSKKEKKKICYNYKKNKKNIEIKKNILKNKEENNIKKSDKYSKTLSNFMTRKTQNEEKPIKINFENDVEFQNELNKPINKEEYDFILPEKYSDKNYNLIKKEKIDDKEVCLYTQNKKEIIFKSGLKKEIFNDGFQLIYFCNGDIKQCYKDGKSIYLYKETNTVQTSYPNGINIFKFSNGQIEKHFPNGFKKIFFPNGTIDYLFDEIKHENI